MRLFGWIFVLVLALMCGGVALVVAFWRGSRSVINRGDVNPQTQKPTSFEPPGQYRTGYCTDHGYYKGHSSDPMNWNGCPECLRELWTKKYSGPHQGSLQ